MTSSRPIPCYLDHASTTPLRPEVAEAIARAHAEGFANPSSQHAAGRQAKQLLEDARERILTAVGGRTAGTARDRVVFTSGASEANRLAILGACRGSAGAVATSARDHSSLRLAAAGAAARGWTLTDLPLSVTGALDMAAVETWLRHTAAAPARVLATTLICGQTGVRETMADIVACIDRHGPCRLHADATQAFAADGVAFGALCVTTLTLAPHKFGGPRGIGALVMRGGVAIEPILPGTQEAGLRAGTEPVALAAGFATALELAVAEHAATAQRLAALRSRFESESVSLARSRGIDAIVVGSTAPRAAHISTVAFPGRDRQAIVMAADLAGLCCATGSACSSGSSEPAPALVAMGLPPETIRGAVRFSFGRTTTAADIDRAIDILRVVLS